MVRLLPAALLALVAAAAGAWVWVPPTLWSHITFMMHDFRVDGQVCDFAA